MPALVKYVPFAADNEYGLVGAWPVGENLSSSFTMDKLGRPRPAIAAWSPGAYQPQLAPTPPTGLKVVVTQQ